MRVLRFSGFNYIISEHGVKFINTAQCWFRSSYVTPRYQDIQCAAQTE